MNVSTATERHPIRVLIVDDQALFSAMLADHLNTDTRIEVVGRAACGEEAIALIDRLRPDVVLMDIEMPGMSCFEVIRRAHQQRPDLHFLVLSAFPNDFYIDQTLAAKARGFMTKQETPQSVVDAVVRVHAGEVCFSQEILNRVVIDGKGARLANGRGASLAVLSPRELDVLRLIAVGYAKKQIAADLGISVSTVENHTARVMRKLGIHDRVELARFAIREKLVNV